MHADIKPKVHNSSKIQLAILVATQIHIRGWSLDLAIEGTELKLASGFFNSPIFVTANEGL
jgi:hypothetical protein